MEVLWPFTFAGHMLFWATILLAIIEGLTEFLPVSSTGHMIIVSSLLGVAADPFIKLFTIAVQLGAILSVVVLYWRRWFKSIEFYLKLIVAFIPAAILGFWLGKYIDALLESVLTVAIALVMGGFVLLYVDRWFAKAESNPDQKVSYARAFVIGCFQTIALIPGISRSAATIIGGLSQGFNRKIAAEFSFFLAVPTMFAATAYKLYQYIDDGGSFTNEQTMLMVLGNVIAFVVAMLAIKGFIGYLERYGFRLFGWYRIALGLLIITLYAAGIELQIV